MAKRSASKAANSSLPFEVREWLEGELRRRGIKDCRKLTAQLARKLLEAAGPATGPAGHNPCCSFCGRARQEVQRLVPGHLANICNDCVGLACYVIEHEQK